MTYRAMQFDFGPDNLAKIGEDLTRQLQDTMVDAQKTLSKSMECGNPVDAWSLQAAFGLRSMQRWMDLAGFGDRNDVVEPASDPAQASQTQAKPAQTSVAPSTAPEPVSPSEPTALFEAEPVSSVNEEPAVEPATAIEIAAPAKDNLQRIRGIGPAISAKLEQRGITDFAHLAALSPAEISALDADMDLKGRIERDDWVAQATALAHRD